MGKISKENQFYSQKWPTKTATKSWRFLLAIFDNLLSHLFFFSLFLLISCCLMTCWNPNTAHQMRLQAFLYDCFCRICSKLKFRTCQYIRRNWSRQICFQFKTQSHFLRLAACFTWSSGWILIVDFRVDFHPQICFALFPSLPTLTRSQNPSLAIGKHRTKNPPQNPSQNPSLWAENSVAKSVTATRKIHRNSTQLRRAPCLR